MRRWAGALGPAALWAAFLFFMSSQSTLPVSLHSGLDKVAHFGAYAVLGAFLAHATLRLGYPIFLALFVGMCYGATDELYQSTVPGRHASVGDWIADVLGVIAGVIFVIIVHRRLRPDQGAPRGGTA